jgi:hypothetical protein
MQAKQIFQQPNAGDAMNGRDAKRDAAQRAVGEIQEFLLQYRLVEKSPLLAFRRAATAHARVIAQIIKVLQAVFRQ